MEEISRYFPGCAAYACPSAPEQQLVPKVNKEYNFICVIYCD